MYIQVYDDRIVGLSDYPMQGYDYQAELPADFNFDYIDDYTFSKGKIAYKPKERAKTVSSEERITALEEQNAFMTECLLEMSEMLYA